MSQQFNQKEVKLNGKITLNFFTLKESDAYGNEVNTEYVTIDKAGESIILDASEIDDIKRMMHQYTFGQI